MKVLCNLWTDITSFFTSLIGEPVLTMEEKLSLSGEMLLKGLGTVFMVLVILWAILSIMGKIFGAQQNKTAAPKKTAPKEEPKVEPAPAVPAAPVSDDGALIAAITAAIEAYRAGEGSGNLPFRVVSFKRKNGSNGWNTGSSEN